MHFKGQPRGTQLYVVWWSSKNRRNTLKPFIDSRLYARAVGLGIRLTCTGSTEESRWPLSYSPHISTFCPTLTHWILHLKVKKWIPPVDRRHSLCTPPARAQWCICQLCTKWSQNGGSPGLLTIFRAATTSSLRRRSVFKYSVAALVLASGQSNKRNKIHPCTYYHHKKLHGEIAV